MCPHQSTNRFIEELTVFSRNGLQRPDDLALLLDAATSADAQKALEEISFHAKFVTRAHRMMARIGKDADGYEKLSSELNASLGKVREMLAELIQAASPEVRGRLTGDYLGMNLPSVQNLFALCSDLMWYKNWLIDH